MESLFYKLGGGHFCILYDAVVHHKIEDLKVYSKLQAKKKLLVQFLEME